MIVFDAVDIPVGLTLNLRWVYPEPSFKTLTAISVLFFSVLKRWIPLADVSVDKPTVLIPVAPNIASFGVLKSLTVFGLTILTKYGSPSDKVSTILFVVSYAEPIPIGVLPFEL